MKELMHGKVKTLYNTDDATTVLIKYEDKVTAFDGKMVDYPKDKGATCCLISALLFEKLTNSGIKTHYLDLPSLNTMLCKKVVEIKSILPYVFCIFTSNYPPSNFSLYVH